MYQELSCGNAVQLKDVQKGEAFILPSFAPTVHFDLLAVKDSDTKAFVFNDGKVEEWHIGTGDLETFVLRLSLPRMDKAKMEAIMSVILPRV